MTEQEAQEMLQKLKEHYGCVVRPVDQYCNALRTWFDIYATERPESRMDIFTMLMNLQKSDLLYRMIYLGEDIRKRLCPEHQGKWSGMGSCSHGCQMTGWLPNS